MKYAEGSCSHKDAEGKNHKDDKDSGEVAPTGSCSRTSLFGFGLFRMSRR